MISPNADDEGSWIHQDAWIFINKPSKGKEIVYPIKKDGNGVYIMLINGTITVDGNKLSNRDAIGVYNTKDVRIFVNEDSEILFLDIPMVF